MALRFIASNAFRRFHEPWRSILVLTEYVKKKIQYNSSFGLTAKANPCVGPVAIVLYSGHRSCTRLIPLALAFVAAQFGNVNIGASFRMPLSDTWNKGRV